MKTNKATTVKIALVSALAHAMCFTVILSHVHASDAVMVSSTHHGATANVSPLTHDDIRMKALGDLHHHIDKTMLKNLANQTAARKRELTPSTDALTVESMGEQIHEFMLRLRIVASLCFNQFSATLAQ